MPTPPSSPDEEEANAIFDASEEENNNNITSALEGEDNDDNDSNEDIEDDGDENENNETIINLQASFQTRITTVNCHPPPSPLIFYPHDSPIFTFD